MRLVTMFYIVILCLTLLQEDVEFLYQASRTIVLQVRVRCGWGTTLEHVLWSSLPCALSPVVCVCVRALARVYLSVFFLGQVKRTPCLALRRIQASLRVNFFCGSHPVQSYKPVLHADSDAVILVMDLSLPLSSLSWLVAMRKKIVF